MEVERIAKLEIQMDSLKDDMKEVRVDIKDLHSRITTGNREIVDKMDDMQTRIEHKMNAQALASQAQHKEIQEEIKNDVKVIDERVQSLEQWKWYVIGAAAIIGWLLAAVVDLSAAFK